MLSQGDTHPGNPSRFTGSKSYSFYLFFFLHSPLPVPSAQVRYWV